MKNKILIFGATGGTGTELMKQSLEKGYEVTVFVRNPERLKLSHSNLSVFKGDVLDYNDVHASVKGQATVFCCLGMPASDKSKLRTLGTDNIVRAMEANGVKRLICQTSLGFGDSKELLPWHMKYVIVPFILKKAFEDHASQEQVIEKSNTEWTIVRPGNMTNGEKRGSYKYGFPSSANIKLKISRADVAHFMLNQLDSTRYYGQKVGISY